MSLIGLFEIEKLKIVAYSDKARTSEVGNFEVQYNPESLSLNYAARMDRPEPASGCTANRWRFNEPARLNVNFVFDGSNVGEMGVALLAGATSVKDRIQNFLECCTRVDSDSHEVPYLRLTWSADIAWSAQPSPPGFDCQLQSADIHYTAFDRDGSPLHAEVAAVFVEQLHEPVRAASLNLRSPDLTHRRVVKSGETLPLLCKEVYGSAAHYMRIAEVNGLDDFRVLEPGTELIFPPYQKRGG